MIHKPHRRLTWLQRKYRQENRWLQYATAFFYIAAILGMMFLAGAKYNEKMSKEKMVTPEPRSMSFNLFGTKTVFAAEPSPTPWQVPDYKRWIDQYARYYFHDEKTIRHTEAIMECVFWKENQSALTNGKGDGGLANGPLQFHMATWTAFRKLMGVSESSPYDLEQAIKTFAWALSTGRGNDWGPILRGECK